MAECYGEAELWERHRHRYEFNTEFRQEMEDAGLVISGTRPDGRLVEREQMSDLFLHPRAFLPEQLQAVVAGCGQIDGLQEQRCV